MPDEAPQGYQPSYRYAGGYLAKFLGLDEASGQATVTELIAGGLLPRNYGRKIVRPQYEGLLLVTIAIVAREAGFSRRAAASFAAHSDRENFADANPQVHGGKVFVRIANSTVTIQLPAGLWSEIQRLEEWGSRNG